MLAAAAALALVVLALTGCSAVDGLVRQVGGAVARAATPVVGECWAASVSTITDYTDWTGSDPVPCTQRHDSYTYRVHKLAGLYEASWQKPGTDGEVRSDVADDAWSTCSDGLSDFLPGIDDRDYRIYFSYFLPSLAQWKAGARWDRCDVSVITLGSRLDSPHFDPLPSRIARFVADFSANPAAYAYCVDTAEAATTDSDPFGSSTARLSDCTKHPQWHQADNDYFPQDADAPFPTSDEIDAFVARVCGPPLKDGVVTVAYPPSEDSWATGDRLVECWSAEGTAAMA